MERRVILQGALALPALAAVSFAVAPAAPGATAGSAPRKARHRSWQVDDLAPRRKAGRS